jgi:hypothetical protein
MADAAFIWKQSLAARGWMGRKILLEIGVLPEAEEDESCGDDWALGT